MVDRRTLLIIARREQKISAVHMQGSCDGVKLEGGLIEGEGEGRGGEGRGGYFGVKKPFYST